MEGRPALSARQVALIDRRKNNHAGHRRPGGIAFHRHRGRYPRPHKPRPQPPHESSRQISQFPRLPTCGKPRRRSGRGTIGAQRRRHHGHHHRLPSSIHAPHTITRPASSVKNPFLNRPDPSAHHTPGRPSRHPFPQLPAGAHGQSCRPIYPALGEAAFRRARFVSPPRLR